MSTYLVLVHLDKQLYWKHLLVIQFCVQVSRSVLVLVGHDMNDVVFGWNKRQCPSLKREQRVVATAIAINTSTSHAAVDSTIPSPHFLTWHSLAWSLTQQPSCLLPALLATTAGSRQQATNGRVGFVGINCLLPSHVCWIRPSLVAIAMAEIPSFWELV